MNEIEIISTIILNYALVFSALIGAVWAFHTFTSSENKAGLSMNIKSISHIKIKKGFILNIIINVKNVGNRELDLDLKKTNINLYFVKNKNYKLIDSSKGRYNDTYSGVGIARIRSSVDYNFNYSFEVSKKGFYYFDFSLTSNMDSYKSKISIFISKITRFGNKILRRVFGIKAIDKDVKYITWVEKQYYNI